MCDYENDFYDDNENFEEIEEDDYEVYNNESDMIEIKNPMCTLNLNDVETIEKSRCKKNSKPYKSFINFNTIQPNQSERLNHTNEVCIDYLSNVHDYYIDKSINRYNGYRFKFFRLNAKTIDEQKQYKEYKLNDLREEYLHETNIENKKEYEYRINQLMCEDFDYDEIDYNDSDELFVNDTVIGYDNNYEIETCNGCFKYSKPIKTGLMNALIKVDENNYRFKEQILEILPFTLKGDYRQCFTLSRLYRNNIYIHPFIDVDFHDELNLKQFLEKIMLLARLMKQIFNIDDEHKMFSCVGYSTIINKTYEHINKKSGTYIKIEKKTNLDKTYSIHMVFYNVVINRMDFDYIIKINQNELIKLDCGFDTNNLTKLRHSASPKTINNSNDLSKAIPIPLNQIIHQFITFIRHDYQGNIDENIYQIIDVYNDRMDYMKEQQEQEQKKQQQKQKQQEQKPIKITYNVQFNNKSYDDLFELFVDVLTINKIDFGYNITPTLKRFTLLLALKKALGEYDVSILQTLGRCHKHDIQKTYDSIIINTQHNPKSLLYYLKSLDKTDTFKYTYNDSFKFGDTTIKDLAKTTTLNDRLRCLTGCCCLMDDGSDEDDGKITILYNENRLIKLSINATFSKFLNEVPPLIINGNESNETKKYAEDRQKNHKKKQETFEIGILPFIRMFKHKLCVVADIDYYNDMFKRKINEIKNKEPVELDKHWKRIVEIYSTEINDEGTKTINLEKYEFILNWFAYAIQHPHTRNQTILMISSLYRGIGKGTFTDALIDWYGRFIFPNTDIDKVLGRFNGFLDYTKMVVINEVDETKKNVDKMKQLADNFIATETKNTNISTLHENNNNFIVFSNHLDINLIEDGDRRFNFIYTEEQPESNEFYTEMYDGSKMKKEYSDNLINFLIHRDLTNYVSNEKHEFDKKILKEHRFDNRSSLYHYIVDQFETKSVKRKNRPSYWKIESLLDEVNGIITMNSIEALELEGVEKEIYTDTNLFKIKKNVRYSKVSMRTIQKMISFDSTDDYKIDRQTINGKKEQVIIKFK